MDNISLTPHSEFLLTKHASFHNAQYEDMIAKMPAKVAITAKRSTPKLDRSDFSELNRLIMTVSIAKAIAESDTQATIRTG
jgi:hypothetical protein